MSKDDLMDALSVPWTLSKTPYEMAQMRQEVEKKMLQHQIKMQANQMLASAQMQQRSPALTEIFPAIAEVNNPDSPMALTIPTMLSLWKQRHGHKWVSEEQIVKDTYWAVIARRLHGLQMLERMEASIGSTWDKTLVFRLKDDEHGY